MKTDKIKLSSKNLAKINAFLAVGKICVLPTDTLYGISCSAFSPQSVNKIYSLKQRDYEKPFIILISSVKDLENFYINFSQKVAGFLNNNWPAPLSVVLDCPSKQLEYLHRGTKSLAFRIPNNKLLLELLKKTGPITSTTVNISQQEPSKTIAEAYKIFGDKIDLYVESKKTLLSKPSTVITFDRDLPIILRQGAYTLQI